MMSLSSLPEHNLPKEGGFCIRCKCGFQILIVPNLRMMTKAIEAHAALHGEREKDPAKDNSEQQRIELDLIAQTLEAAAKISENGYFY
jgi:hypothetical protein